VLKQSSSIGGIPTFIDDIALNLKIPKDGFDILVGG
jgi:hypothetical protein